MTVSRLLNAPVQTKSEKVTPKNFRSRSGVWWKFWCILSEILRMTRALLSGDYYILIMDIMKEQYQNVMLQCLFPGRWEISENLEDRGLLPRNNHWLSVFLKHYTMVQGHSPLNKHLCLGPVRTGLSPLAWNKTSLQEFGNTSAIGWSRNKLR